MEAVVEPNEEVQLDFAGPSGTNKNKDVYVLVAIDKWSKFPTAQTNIKYNGRCSNKIYAKKNISNNGVPRKLRSGQAQLFREKKFWILCKYNN